MLQRKCKNKSFRILTWVLHEQSKQQDVLIRLGFECWFTTCCYISGSIKHFAIKLFVKQKPKPMAEQNQAMQVDDDKRIRENDAQVWI